MRVVLAIMVLILGTLQFQLWLGERGLPGVWKRQDRLRELEATTDRLERRNRRLRAEVEDLRQEGEAIVERAREDLGMIREDEIFIRMVRPRGEEAPGGDD